MRKTLNPGDLNNSVGAGLRSLKQQGMNLKYLQLKTKKLVQSGFTMVELMIAITLSLLLSIAVFTIFYGINQGLNTASSNAALTDNGRFAANFLNQALRTAGYMGCSNSSVVVSTAPSVNAMTDFNHAVLGYQANSGTAITLSATPVSDTSASDWTPNLPTGSALGLVGSAIQNSDVLVIHSTTQQAPVTVTSIANGAAIFNVTSTANFKVGQVATIADCAKATAFQVTSVSGNTLGHAANASMVPGNAASAFTVNFANGALVTVPNTVFFYIAPGADGDGALFKSVLTYNANGIYSMTASEIVPDIENMQVLYGVDLNGDQQADNYQTADQVADFGTVVAVKVALLAATHNITSNKPATAPVFNLFGLSVTAPADFNQRQVYEIDVALRNSLP